MLTDSFYYTLLDREIKRGVVERFVVIARDPTHLFRVTSALVEAGRTRFRHVLTTSTRPVPLHQIRRDFGPDLEKRGKVVIPDLRGTLTSVFQAPLDVRSYVYLDNGTWDAAQ